MKLRDIKSVIVGRAEADLNFHTNLDRYAGFIQNSFVVSIIQSNMSKHRSAKDLWNTKW